MHTVSLRSPIPWLGGKDAMAPLLLEAVMQRNAEKLRRRSPNGFHRERSIHRTHDEEHVPVCPMISPHGGCSEDFLFEQITRL